MARILLAEDEESVRGLFGLWLSGEGHQVTEARDGVEAQELLAGQSFDVAVIDVIMPRLDGISLIRDARPRYPDTRMVAISAGSHDLPAAVGLPLSSMFGADAVLYKPFDRSEFLAAVSRLVG